MAPRVFLLCILFTIGILTDRITGTTGIDLTLGFVQEPEDVVVGRGQPALLNCSAFSDPEFGPARISWALDDKPLVIEEAVISSASPSFSLTPPPSLSPRRVVSANGSLFFKKVVHKRTGGVSDQGTYRCIARNSVGVLVSRPAQLRVAVLSHNFSEVATEQVVEEKDVARFRCQIDSIPTALISWERNRAPLPQDSRYFVLSSGVLQIVGVQPSDAGSYRCIANNAVAKKQRRSPEASLTVDPFSGKYRPPQFLMWPPATNETASAPTPHSTSLPLSSHSPLGTTTFTEVVVKQGQDLVLECSASGWPVPQISWSRSPSLTPGIKGETEIHREVVSATTAGTNNLQLKTVQVQDGGAYFCMATNRNSENQVTSITQAIWVGVLAPPIFIRPPTSQVFPTAKTVRFECEVGLPPGPGSRLFPPLPPVVWLKDGSLLDINGRVKQRPSELVLSDTVTDDSGLYQCVAHIGKHHGPDMEVWSAARLLVNVSRYQPEPPRGLTCRPHSPSQVQLDWLAPPPLRSGEGSAAGSYIQAYTVHYLPTDGGLEQQAVAVNKTFLVDKLIPYTNYTFYVRAYSGRSASDQSMRVICRTGEGVPQAAPEISLDTSSPTTLRVWWKPLEAYKTRGVITEHKIQWRRHGNPSTNVEYVKGYVHEYTITELLPGKKYEVRVLAATNMGWPDVPDDQLKWKQFEMPSYDQQNVPSTPNVQLTVVNSTSIEVTWSMPRDEKIALDGFKLYYRKQNGNQLGPINISGNVFHYLLTGLEPQVQYKVMLQGYNQEGNGSMGVKAIYTLPPESSVVHRNGGEDVPAPAPPAPPTSPDDPGGQQGITGDVEPPTGLEAQPTSPRSINLTWIPPSTSASYYTVSYNPVQSSLSVNSSTVKYIRSTSNSVEIGDLKPFTLYEFKVRSHDQKNQQGPYGDKVECLTLEDVPSVPQDVLLKAKNTTCIRLSWKEPHLVNGAVKYYVVRYSADPSISLEKWALIKYPGNQYVAEVNGLSPNIQYYLNLRAETGAGEGEAVELIARTFSTSAVSGVTEPPDDSVAGEQNDQHLGIVVGIVIGVGFMAICGASFICRRQCQKTSSPDLPPGNSGRCGSSLGGGQHGVHVPGIGGHANGNGLCKDRGRGFVVGSGGGLVQSLTGGGAGEAHEMEFFTPMLVCVPPEANAHLDTKGGYPNGQINGFKHSLLSNGRIPNGHVARGNVHITENPQYDSGAEARIPLPKHANRYTVNGGGAGVDGDGNNGVGSKSLEKASNLLLGDSEEEEEDEAEAVMKGAGGNVSGGSVGDPDTTQLTCLSYDADEEESGCHVIDTSEEGVREDSDHGIPTREVVSTVTPAWQQELARHEEERHLFPMDGSGDACDHKEDQPVAGSLVSKSGARRHVPHMLGFTMPQPPSTSTPLLVPKG